MREKDKLSATLDGIKNMGGLPEALFVIDVTQEHIAIQEANRLGIPVIAIVDTNAKPDGVDYIIPGNDDASRAIRLYCKSFADTIIEARGVLNLKEQQKAPKDQVAPKKKIMTKKAAVKAVSKVQVNDGAGQKEKLQVNNSDQKIEAEAKGDDGEKKPATKKTVAKKTVAKKTVAKKTAVKKPAAKKKVVAKKKVLTKTDSEVSEIDEAGKE